MLLSDEQLSIIKAHVIDCYPNEAVIGITATEAIPLTNIHDNPKDYFRVSSKEFYLHDFIALVHSHTSYPSKGYNVSSYWDIRTPSKNDMIAQKNLNIPFGIIGYDGDNITDLIWFPDYDSPIMNQPFIYGVYDCYRIIKAWYWQNWQIKLMDHPREFDWKEVDNLYNTKYEEAGFYEVDRSLPLEIGDMIYMRINGNYDNHAALYIGDGKILHHLNNRLPTIEHYAKWRSKVTKHLRYNKEK